MRLGRARLLASAAAICTLAGALAAVVIPSTDAAAGARVPLAGSAAPLPAGAVRLGAVPAGRTLTVDVTLKLGNEAGLDALLAGLADKKSPYFRHFVGKDQFGPEFGLSAAGIATVRDGLRSLGLDPGPTDPDRLFIPVTGTAAAIGRAFGTTLVNYRLPGGRVAYENTAAPRVPASIAPYIQGIIGLDNINRAQRASQRQPSGGAGRHRRGHPRHERGPGGAPGQAVHQRDERGGRLPRFHRRRARLPLRDERPVQGR